MPPKFCFPRGLSGGRNGECTGEALGKNGKGAMDMPRLVNFEVKDLLQLCVVGKAIQVPKRWRAIPYLPSGTVL